MISENELNEINSELKKIGFFDLTLDEIEKSELLDEYTKENKIVYRLKFTRHNAIKFKNITLEIP